MAETTRQYYARKKFEYAQMFSRIVFMPHDYNPNRSIILAQAVGLHTYASWSEIEEAWYVQHPDIEEARAMLTLLLK